MNLENSIKIYDGILDSIRHLAVIKESNQRISEQREHAKAIQRKIAQLETGYNANADREQAELQRREIERQRAQADEAERRVQREQAEQVKQLRNLMADSFSVLEQMRKTQSTH